MSQILAGEGEENGRDHKGQRLGYFRHIVQRPPYVCEIGEMNSSSGRKRNPLSVLRRRWRVHPMDVLSTGRLICKHCGIAFPNDLAFRCPCLKCLEIAFPPTVRRVQQRWLEGQASPRGVPFFCA